MNITVLVVEDDTLKYGRIHKVLRDAGVAADSVKHVVTAADAMAAIRAQQFDLMLLDVNIPRRLGEQVQRGGGLDLLKDLQRDEVRKPNYVVGVTAFVDVVEEFGGAFDEHLWTLVHYSENSDRWVAQLGLKVEYITRLKQSGFFTDGVTYGTDVAIITALETVELAAVRRLPYDWQPLRLTHDETRYWSGTTTIAGAPRSVVAAAAPRMGLSASAVLAAKMIHQFRPKLLVMLGICAGRSEKTALGDIIVADPTWDWGSGKIESRKGAPHFLPDPHQLDVDPQIISSLKDLADDPHLLLDLRLAAVGRKPPTELKVHFGPMVSGAAVVAHKPTFAAIIEQHRKVLGLDMEAYGVAAAALGSGNPRPTTIIIKSVADYADSEKQDDFQEYAADVSAKFLGKAIEKLL